MSFSLFAKKNQGGIKRSAQTFALSIVFLPLPIAFGGSFLNEMLDQTRSIAGFGLGAGDLLFLGGMLAWVIFLIVAPLAGFAWGQILTWAQKERLSKVPLAYICLSIAYLLLAVSIAISIMH